MEIGQTLNQRYTLTARLGKGAMGIVYRALDTQTGQEVAVKVIARELSLDHDMLERFRREGEALRQLRHPNIVGFVDMFEYEDQHVIVMEYVPGGSLHDLLRQGPLPLDRVRRIALELCDALTRAHHLAIIHRDLKPENVLLTADGSAKLTDFGVARLVSEGTRLTGTGTQVGTPFYMSPEAWEGRPLDAQADIWSLGILLYEMLSGRVPFTGDTVVAVMNKVLNAPLPDLTTLRPDVPPGLAQIIQRMLARDQSQRYQTMRELGADLERGQPLTMVAAPPTRAEARPTATRVAGTRVAGPKPSKGFPWLLVGAAGLGLLVIVAAAVGLGGWWLASHPALTVAPAPIATRPWTPPPTLLSTSAPSATLAPIAPTQPAPTPAALVQPPRGNQVQRCGADLCVVDDQGQSQPLGLAGQYLVDKGFGASADGAAIAFSGCPADTPAGGNCASLYLVDRISHNVKPLVVNDVSGHALVPSWSPDGAWIAYHKNCWLALIRPDGTGAVDLAFDQERGCPLNIAWSPDSQRLAWIGENSSTNGSLGTYVWVINQDKGGMHVVFHPANGQLSPDNINTIAWSPDSKSVAVVMQDQATRLIDVDACSTKPNGCDESGVQTLGTIPKNWLGTFWPRWGLSLTKSKTLTLCDQALCVVDDQSRHTVLNLGSQYTLGLGFSWSPDGTQIVFGASQAKDNTGGVTYTDLYLADQNGQNVTPLLQTPNRQEHFPSWSPDGNWIAYHQNCTLALIRPDGTSNHTLSADTRRACPFGIAWSPNSQQIAWIGGADTPETSTFNSVWIVHSDGSGLQSLFTITSTQLTENLQNIGIAWSPDGKSVAAKLQNGATYLIDAACASRPNGCDEASRQITAAVPASWRNTYWPQWNGQAGPSNVPLNIGLLLPLSGPNAGFGASARDGSQMAVDEWNAQGGLLGGTVLPILADGQCKADPAVAAANRLFDQEGVRFLIGELCSTASIPVSAIAESKGVVQISPSSSSMTLTLNPDGSTKAYVFRACFVDPFQGTVMANFALGQPLQRAYVLWDKTSDYSQGLATYFVDAFTKGGGTIVGKEAYTTQTTDFTAILAKVAASGAQVLFVPDFSARVNLIARQAKARKLTAVLMGGDGWEGSDLDLEALNGGYYTTGYSPLAPNAGAQAWAARFRANYNRDPDAMAALAYDAANLLFTAIRQADTDEPARVKEVLASLKFEGITGSFAFDAQHNPLKSAVIMQIKNGQRVYVDTVNP